MTRTDFIYMILCAVMALLALSLATAYFANEARQIPRAATSVNEDEPGWDCKTMGNMVCGE